MASGVTIFYCERRWKFQNFPSYLKKAIILLQSLCCYTSEICPELASLDRCLHFLILGLSSSVSINNFSKKFTYKKHDSKNTISLTDKYEYENFKYYELGYHLICMVYVIYHLV